MHSKQASYPSGLCNSLTDRILEIFTIKHFLLNSLKQKNPKQQQQQQKTIANKGIIFGPVKYAKAVPGAWTPWLTPYKVHTIARDKRSPGDTLSGDSITVISVRLLEIYRSKQPLDMTHS